ncbi:MAG: sigma-54 dependent transcriptional regulator [Desulfosoma sp.]
MARILVVDDEKKMRHLLSMMLENRGHTADQAEDGREALDRLSQRPYDLVITDIRMPHLDGRELFREMKNLGMDIPVIFITAFATVESAVESLQDGVVDYISKPFEEERILATVERTLNLSRILEENKDLRNELRRMSGSEEIIFRSEAMKRVVDLVKAVAEEDTTVLIRGESGTGKELLARFIHNMSPRHRKRFVPVNCAAIPQGLIESELFGHEKGAFTSADRRSLGKFETASQGTLFLDEIGDMPLDAQAKLLRVLQEKKIQRIGGQTEIPVDVRIVCATNQDLEGLVQEGRFRADLFYRINVFPIELPPLRDRLEDVPLLARHFAGKFFESQDMEITPGAMDLLVKYTWPGNVRELANVMERACILAKKSRRITAEHLIFLKPSAGGESDGGASFKLPAQGINLEILEMELVEQALAMANNNQSAAARLLGLTRAKFRVLYRQYIDYLRNNRRLVS